MPEEKWQDFQGSKNARGAKEVSNCFGTVPVHSKRLGDINIFKVYFSIGCKRVPHKFHHELSFQSVDLTKFFLHSTIKMLIFTTVSVFSSYKII